MASKPIAEASTSSKGASALTIYLRPSRGSRQSLVDPRHSSLWLVLRSWGFGLHRWRLNLKSWGLSLHTFPKDDLCRHTGGSSVMGHPRDDHKPPPSNLTRGDTRPSERSRNISTDSVGRRASTRICKPCLLCGVKGRFYSTQHTAGRPYYRLTYHSQSRAGEFHH